jgi:hypothetical protein
MQIKRLIQQLTELEASYDQEYREVMGEPEISIDLFRRKYPGGANYDRLYSGISNEIVIEKHPHNWPSPVIVSFAEAYENPNKNSQNTQSQDCCAAWPQEWQT